MKLNFLHKEPNRLLFEVLLETELNSDGLQRIIRDTIVSEISKDYVSKNSAKILSQIDTKELVNLTKLNISTGCTSNPYSNPCPGRRNY